ncbi:SubName: Full=Uncharacterized protein {ECO:0000313/EMBL:CCA67420.1} [Serendipita indica DSM 11827]|uniref:Uncharacterized protein n=1 Tax=Serendipita indica (strain DSM 11827) TaxID=1109443 RepID=G4T7R8_SERID|nr:SubName: Full=Uncharacterized protein {ECO:0000313/EMBL:CCA67420.1} [Serendipita indica DSM 11827]CCA67420.1 hypothetical protein PIIN_01251 [Serendipita indica DSM 11827]
MSYTTYRPPPPAPSAFFALQLAASSSSAAPLQAIVDATIPSNTSVSSTASMDEMASTTTGAAPSTFLPRIPSKISINVTTQAIAQQVHAATSSGNNKAPSRTNSASSITALPSLSSSLNNLHAATSIDHLDVCGTRTAEADELLRRVIQGNVKRLSSSSIHPAGSLPPSYPAGGPGSSTNIAYHAQTERVFTRYDDDSSADESDDSNDDGDAVDNLPSSSATSSLSRPSPLRSSHSTSHSDYFYHPNPARRSSLDGNTSPTSPPSPNPLPRSSSTTGIMMNSRKDRLAARPRKTPAFAF